MSREFKIGLFGVLMIACLYLGINFLKGMDIFSGSKKYYAVYDQVNGLQPSAGIVIKGFKVGTITDMIYDPRISDKVIVELSVKSRYKIPLNSQARVYSEGIMSGKSIEIVLGTSPEHLSPGDTLFASTEKDLFELAGSEFDYVKERFGELVDNLNGVLTNINSMLEKNDANVATSVANLAAVTGNINRMIVEERGQIHHILSGFSSLAGNLEEKNDDIDRIIGNIGSFSDSLAQSQIPTAIAEMTATLTALNTTIARINQGEGTVGKFLNNDQLYDELVEASGNLNLLLEDIKQRPGRYVNISVFGRKDRD